MINRIYALILVSLLATNCTKSEQTYETLISDTAISFAAEELSADWESKSTTRGVATNDMGDVSSIMVYAFLTEPGDIEVCYIDHEEATVMSDDGLWGFTPARYYPKNYTLDFLSYTPEANATSGDDNNGITQTLDFDNKEITISYSAPTTARNQPDLMLATPTTEHSDDNPLVNLEFNHALTQVSMSAKVGGETESGRYVITRFTFHDITIAADLTYSVDNGFGTWTESSNGEFITSAMLPNSSIATGVDDLGNTTYEDPVELPSGDDYVSIMSNGHTLFMIPQAIEGKSGTAPTIQITITDTEPTYDIMIDEETGEAMLDDDGEPITLETFTYLTYRTDKLALPSPGDAGWLMGQHVNLQFEFDIDKANEVIPLSFTAKLLDWIETDVDKEIDANIYAYLSVDSIAAGVTTVTLYTNGTVSKVGGVGTEYSTSGDNSYSITISGAGELTVNIDNSDGTTITKNFTITPEE